jgi:uncharacterized membrane protein
MSLGLILIIVLVIFLLGGFSGRFGGYGYGFGHGGIGVIGIILIILVVLLLMGRLWSDRRNVERRSLKKRQFAATAPGRRDRFSDIEQADLARERKELSENAGFELDELAEIYVKRGVDQPLARQVAR